VNGLGTK